jgi:hypothetical protein
MADPTEEEPLDNPKNMEPENPSGEFIPATDTGTINPIRETENMEVHHHSHAHGKKNWKSYLWEFLMLFLAVFCGFLAEYQLEHTIEHNREKEFIISMIEDAETDMVSIHAAISLNKQRALKMDSLAQLCFNYDAAKNQDSAIYRLYRAALTHPSVVSPTERTLSQLKNSGGMRLIRKKGAVDRIIKYDDAGKKIKEQQEFYEMSQFELGKLAFELFNFKNYNLGKYNEPAADPKLLNNDKSKLIVFGNKVVFYGAVVIFYNERLKQMDKDAEILINTLRKEYHVE